ncbi:MAG TPA: hypothetical protein VGK43_01370, partial [Solirubrobacterales bacterium]
ESRSCPVPFDGDQAFAVSRADIDVAEKERVLLNQRCKGQSGKLAAAALERAERRAKRSRAI